MSQYSKHTYVQNGEKQMHVFLKNRFRSDIDVGLLENPLSPRGSENARWLLAQRYCLDRWDDELKACRPERGIEEVARRVSRVLAASETAYAPESEIGWIRTLEKNLFSDILNFQFLFNSPCLYGCGAGLTVQPQWSRIIYCSPDELSWEDYRRLAEGRTANQQLFACFVVSVPDSIEGIFDAVKDAAIISKYGGGVGANFGHLRESGAPIKGGTGGKASGPVSFMETWNTMGSVVVQGGRRRAALMGMLPDNHPDIERFMDAKTEDGRLPYFNISVCVSDRLVNAAREGGDFPLVSRVDGKTAATVPAAQLWDKLCSNAWRRGDPGVFFIDRAGADNLLREDPEFVIESTNPCGEQPLPNYTSCNLGSINLSAFVAPDGSGQLAFDEARFVDQVYRSMVYLDLVIDSCSYPLERIGRRTRQIRPVGLGLMGLADAAIASGLVYGSPEFSGFCDRLASVMAVCALLATVDSVDHLGKGPFAASSAVVKLFAPLRDELGGDLFMSQTMETLDEEGFLRVVGRMKELGLPYTLCNTLQAAPGVLKRLEGGSPEELRRLLGAVLGGRMRNSRRLSIAPTGSISMLLDASAGIEPNFAWSWNRKVMKSDGNGYETRQYFHRLVTDEGKRQLSAGGKLEDPRFVTAYDLSPEGHVEVTGIFARYVDSGISKTVNLPSSATVDDVKAVYERCYDLGCKGITIYRDGSRSEQPIEVSKPAEKAAPAPDGQTPVVKTAHTGRVKQRSTPIVMGKTIKDVTPWGSLFVTLNYDGSEPFEVFASLGKSGSELKSMTEALSRVISIGLRSGGHLEDFISTLRGLSGKEYWTFDCDDSLVVRSIPDALAILLGKLIEQDERPAEGTHTCPECGAPMELVGGCAYCFSCGYSPCK